MIAIVLVHLTIFVTHKLEIASAASILMDVSVMNVSLATGIIQTAEDVIVMVMQIHVIQEQAIVLIAKILLLDQNVIGDLCKIFLL